MWSAIKEYCVLGLRAWWVWLAGPVATLIGYAATAFPPSNKFPIWAWAIIALAISVFATQFRVYQVVRVQRDALRRARASQSALTDLGALRVETVLLRNKVPLPEDYPGWQKEFDDLRAKIKKKIEESPGAAEAKSYETVGNLHHKWSGIHDAHRLRAIMLTRDIEWLEAFIARYSKPSS
jgi:hypothetical protein